MADYPGEILRRFGRYQAIASLGRAGAADLWRAWDPYLDRFVDVAVLQDADRAEVRTRTANLDEAVRDWTGGKHSDGSQVLDFDPGSEESDPFIVLATAEDEQRLEGRLLAGPPERRASGLKRNWDLLVAAGGMLLAGVLAWMLRGMFSEPAQPPVARPTATVAATVTRREAAATTTPTYRPRIVAPSSAVTATIAAAPTASPERQPSALDVDVLIGRWLTQYCQGVERRYRERGRREWRCSWRDVETSGSLPTMLLRFTRVDRAEESEAGAAMELRAREQFRLTCNDAECSRLVPVPGTEEETSGKSLPTATNVVPQAPRNQPPVVAILTAPQRVAPGGRVVLRSQVTDPDSAAGDELECLWSVDGKPVARLCWELVWTVPATRSYGNVVFTLKARDRQGATDAKSVSVLVGPPE